MLTQRRKYALVFVAVGVWIIQIGLTVVNEIRWPFCCHNLYYHRSHIVKPILKVRLIDDQGGEQLVDTRHVLPVDGDPTGSIMREVFVDSDSQAKKQAFAISILNRLNGTSWSGFDERFAPAQPKRGSRFVGLSLERVWVDTRDFAKTREAPTVRRESVYVYDSREKPNA